MVKYSTGNSAYNGLNPADFYTTDTYTTSFPDDNCGIDPEQKCNRPYKHPLQNILLSGHLVKEVRISTACVQDSCLFAIYPFSHCKHR